MTADGGEPAATMPTGEAAVRAAAAAAGIAIPPAALAGVVRNAALLDRHAAVLRARPPR